MKILLITILIILIITSIAFTNIDLTNGINEVRLSSNLNILQHKPLLDSFAEYRFNKMLFPISHEYISWRSDYDFFMLWSHGLNSSYIGEIIVFGHLPYTTEECIAAWFKSPLHRQAILNKNFTHMGTYSGYKYKHYITIVEFERGL